MRRSSRFATAAAVLTIAVLFGGCVRAGSNIPDPAGVARETTNTFVYFSTGRSLVEEERVVDAKNVYGATLDELLAAKPERNTKIAIVQPVAKVRGVTFKDGVLTIDWSREVLSFAAEPKEKLIALAAVLRTFGQFPEVKKVSFTVEGATEGKLDGRDVQAFWGSVSLKAQPWDVIRSKPVSKDASSAAEKTMP
jgi:hypothetical protein